MTRLLWLRPPVWRIQDRRPLVDSQTRAYELRSSEPPAGEIRDAATIVKLHDTSVLEQLKPHFNEAPPRLRLLLHDDQRIHFDDLATVSEAARAAIAKLEAMPQAEPSQNLRGSADRCGFETPSLRSMTSS